MAEQMLLALSPSWLFEAVGGQLWFLGCSLDEESFSGGEIGREIWAELGASTVYLEYLNLQMSPNDLLRGTEGRRLSVSYTIDSFKQEDDRDI